MACPSPWEVTAKRSFVVEVLKEVEGLGDAAVLSDELDAVFFYEGGGFHFFQQTDALEREVAKREKGFSDVVAGELIFFQQQDATIFLGEDGGCGCAGGPSADDDDVV